MRVRERAPPFLLPLLFVRFQVGFSCPTSNGVNCRSALDTVGYRASGHRQRSCCECQPPCHSKLLCAKQLRGHYILGCRLWQCTALPLAFDFTALPALSPLTHSHTHDTCATCRPLWCRHSITTWRNTCERISSPPLLPSQSGRLSVATCLCNPLTYTACERPYWVRVPCCELRHRFPCIAHLTIPVCCFNHGQQEQPKWSRRHCLGTGRCAGTQRRAESTFIAAS